MKLVNAILALFSPSPAELAAREAYRVESLANLARAVDAEHLYAVGPVACECCWTIMDNRRINVPALCSRCAGEVWEGIRK